MTREEYAELEAKYFRMLAEPLPRAKPKPKASALARAEERWAAKRIEAVRQDAERASAALREREEEEAERWERKRAASASAAIKKMLERRDDPGRSKSL